MISRISNVGKQTLRVIQSLMREGVQCQRTTTGTGDAQDAKNRQDICTIVAIATMDTRITVPDTPSSCSRFFHFRCFPTGPCRRSSFTVNRGFVSDWNILSHWARQVNASHQAKGQPKIEESKSDVAVAPPRQGWK